MDSVGINGDWEGDKVNNNGGRNGNRDGMDSWSRFVDRYEED